MTTTIPAVDTENVIEHGVLIDLTLNGTTYYISNCYKAITYNSITYEALAGFLTVSEIQSTISSSDNDIQVGLSAIPNVYITAILGQPIKGGTINIYRAFFNYQTQEVIVGEIYKRFSGVITNFNVQEDINVEDGQPTATHTITVTASSILGILDTKFSGRRTNKRDYQYNWAEQYFTGSITSDPSMDRVEALYNATFDFGRDFVTRGIGVNNGGTGAGAGQSGGRISDLGETQER